MADDKSKRDARDRNKVAAGHQYDVANFAQKPGLSAVEARETVDVTGPDDLAGLLGKLFR